MPTFVHAYCAIRTVGPPRVVPGDWLPIDVTLGFQRPSPYKQKGLLGVDQFSPVE